MKRPMERYYDLNRKSFSDSQRILEATREADRALLAWMKRMSEPLPKRSTWPK